MRLNDLIRLTLNENRAVLYHGTSFVQAIEILQTGVIKAGVGQGISTSRDRRLRYYGSEERLGHFRAPVQFVLNTDAIRQHYQVRPFDHFPGIDYENDPLRRSEREELIQAQQLPVNNRTVTEIIIHVPTPSYLKDPNYDEPHIQDGRVNPEIVKKLTLIAQGRNIPVRSDSSDVIEPAYMDKYR